MNDLRWILLVAGLLLIAGIYVWGVRARRRAAAPEHERLTRVEPARTVAVVPERAEPEPEISSEGLPLEARDAPTIGAIDVEPSAMRREPRLEPEFVEPLDEEPPTVRLESGLGRRTEPRVEPRVEAPPPPPRRPALQRIVALRVVAPGGNTIAGERLLEALQADGFTFGRYQIFHRLDESGRPMVSLASLKEPGTFDPESMPGAQFRGMALFTVLPGPLPGLRAFDELIVTARALAATLGAQLQDERGGPLSLQRIGHLREEVAEFERARGAVPNA